MLAWHFLSEDKRLGYGDGRLVEVGQTLECEGKHVLCSNGMHGSICLIDALAYASGPIICRVAIDGDVIEGEDKLCGRRRTVLWWLDATSILHEFACQCAEDALALIENPDPRSMAGIEAKRKWLAGEITEDELAAASEAAWSAWSSSQAASAAAWDAALDAAWDATEAAWDAARDAARAAAWSAARAAAWSAARSAASAAEREAARDAARAAARAQQNARLTEMVMDAHEKEDE